MIYTLKGFTEKTFTEKMDLIRFIKKDYENILQQKLAIYKTGANVNINDELVDKAFKPKIESISADFIKVKSVINTTNIIDSHMDLHLSDIWNKTVKDNPYSYHLKEHEAKFRSVLSNKAKSYNEKTNFNVLGLNKNFNTTANINEFILSKKENEFMFYKYANGDVLEHSIGMIYVNLELAYYDEDSQKNMDFFNKAKSQAINPEVADERGYVWVVSEAKKREGSAVVFGSNSATPTLEVLNYEPQKSTQKNKEADNIITSAIDYKFLINNFKLK
jgi:hypothetical protein